MNRMNRFFLLVAAACVAAPALAHPGHHAHDSAFLAGLLHPLTGLDHLAAMLAVGMWSALALRKPWQAPLVFLVLLALGALAGFSGLAVPAVEPMIAASLLVLGLLLASRRQLPLAAAATLAGAFAFFHGAAHGHELSGGDTAGALAGMLLATGALHGTGIALGHLVLQRRRWLPLASGGSVALLGATMLARLA